MILRKKAQIQLEKLNPPVIVTSNRFADLSTNEEDNEDDVTMDDDSKDSDPPEQWRDPLHESKILKTNASVDVSQSKTSEHPDAIRQGAGIIKLTNKK